MLIINYLKDYAFTPGKRFHPWKDYAFTPGKRFHPWKDYAFTPGKVRFHSWKGTLSLLERYAFTLVENSACM